MGLWIVHRPGSRRLIGGLIGCHTGWHTGWSFSRGLLLVRGDKGFLGATSPFRRLRVGPRSGCVDQFDGLLADFHHICAIHHLWVHLLIVRIGAVRRRRRIVVIRGIRLICRCDWWWTFSLSIAFSTDHFFCESALQRALLLFDQGLLKRAHGSNVIRNCSNSIELMASKRPNGIFSSRLRFDVSCQRFAPLSLAFSLSFKRYRVVISIGNRFDVSDATAMVAFRIPQ
mmetsp:Transcript_19313/g.48071  ORF Transcript_19313/g.48071 Transcript_19313/m.48071 type:complete len:228 (+) Transcript_19313:400-1083(+)